MPVFPGQLRYIRKNLFYAISVIDPATVCGLEVSFILCHMISDILVSYYLAGLYLLDDLFLFKSCSPLT